MTTTDINKGGAEFDLAAYDAPGEALILNLEGFEGPLHVLLVLARAQKVDITQLSILDLVEQYLSFIAEANELKLEVAADYLVMAAWLAYLKSRLLLPDEGDDDEPSALEMAARLQLRLQRLEAMREAGAQLMSRNRLGRDVFMRGNPEGIELLTIPLYDATSYYELLRAYSDIQVRARETHLTIKKRNVFSMEEALNRLVVLVGQTLTWTELKEFLPEGLLDAEHHKSAIASTFAATLELARSGKAEIKQVKPFGPMYVKGRAREVEIEIEDEEE
ncbi:MAG: ScpA family protein [Sphingomonadales bacterium]